MSNIISSYTLEEAIADGVLIEIFKNRWQELTEGKPIIATTHLFNEISLAGLQEIWNAFVEWRTRVMATLPEEEQMFTTTVNDRTVWVVDDGYVYTVMYPEDY